MKDLSILIPTFNDECVTLVEMLHQQAEALGIGYEIIVADDGSTDYVVMDANRGINLLPHCRLIERKKNAGRAAIRNFLAQQAAFPWILFIDSDMVVCREDYLRQYAQRPIDESIVCGGVVIGSMKAGNLRSMYEKASEKAHTPERRQQSPYQDFHTANFMIRRDLTIQYPFDIRFQHYGYEDVLFGKALQQAGIPIVHIDNPLSFEIFETNDVFINKTEEGLQTLSAFQEELRGYSRLLDLSEHLPKMPIRLWHRFLGKWERQKLTGKHTSLFWFKIHKIGYFLSLDKGHSGSI